jgi:hypothetical protein
MEDASTYAISYNSAQNSKYQSAEDHLPERGLEGLEHILSILDVHLAGILCEE